MLGNPGSNPLEMFWDVVDELDQVLDIKIDHAEAVLKRNSPSFVCLVETTDSELRAALGSDHDIPDDDVADVFAYVRRSSLITSRPLDSPPLLPVPRPCAAAPRGRKTPCRAPSASRY